MIKLELKHFTKNGRSYRFTINKFNSIDIIFSMFNGLYQVHMFGRIISHDKELEKQLDILNDRLNELNDNLNHIKSIIK